MTINEIIIKLASKQGSLTNKSAECTVLRNEIAELNRQLKVLKEREKQAKKVKPATKPSAARRKSAKSK